MRLPSDKTFAAFARAFLPPLSEYQEQFAAVAFDGLDPCDVGDAARDIYRCERVPAVARTLVLALLGRGSGKSMLGGARGVHLAAAISKDDLGLAPGQKAYCLFFSSDLNNARDSFDFARGLIDRNRGRLPFRLVRETTDEIELLRSDGVPIVMRARASAKAGSSARGITVIYCERDEAAFNRQRDGERDEDLVELIRAVRPRLATGGQIFCPTTPWSEEGGAYEIYSTDFGRPRRALVALGRTEKMRADDPDVLERCRQYREAEPNAAERELDCSFIATGSDFFFKDVLGLAIEHDPPELEQRAKIGAGIDLGFLKDASALVITRRDGLVVRVAEVDVVRPTNGPLDPEVVFQRFANVLKRYRVTSVRSDDHFLPSLRPYLRRHGVDVRRSPKGEDVKLDEYSAVRAAMVEGRLKIPGHEKELIREIGEVKSQPSSGGHTKIWSPRRKGSHGDIVSALVNAFHHCAGRGSFDPSPRAGGRMQMAGINVPIGGRPGINSPIDGLEVGPDGRLNIPRGRRGSTQFKTARGGF